MHNSPINHAAPHTSFSLTRQKGLIHGFFTAEGGVSEASGFESLNCSYKSGDNPEHVSKNLQMICERLGVDRKNLRTVKQIHSKKVITILDNSTPTADLEADALVTNVRGLLLGIATADCVPILFYDPHNRIIAAAHAGWKGALDGIIENTVRAIEELGGMAPSLFVTLGPSIQQYSYEVGQEFYDTFLTTDKENAMFFIPAPRKEHYMFDLPGYCVYRLRRIGILRVEKLGVDTYSNVFFFSFRRATHEGKKTCGNQLSAICLK